MATGSDASPAAARTAPRWPWLVPVLLAAAAYAPAPWGDLVWDDEVVVEYQLDRFRDLGDVFRPPEGIVRYSYGYYRPVVMLTYLADARLFGAGAAMGPHVMNVLLHVLVTLLAGWLAWRLLGDRPGRAAGALAAAALFAVHPVHAESVSWIAGRSDTLATLFLLAALLAALRWRDTGARAALAAAPLLLLLGLLSKESAVTGVALLPLVLLLAPPPAGGDRLRAAPFPPGPDLGRVAAAALLGVLATAAYLWLRSLANPDSGAVVEAGAVERLALLLRAAGYYLLKLFVPPPQSALVPWSLAPAWPLALALVAAAAALTALAARAWRRAGDGLPLLAAAWFWVTISLPLYVAVAGVNNTPLAERYLYLPSVALALRAGAAVAACWARGWRRAVLAAAALVLAAGLAACVERARVWQTDLALWTDTTRIAGVSGLAWLNLGLNQLEAGDEAAALASLARVKEDPDIHAHWLSRAENAAGTIDLRRGALDAAEAKFRAAARASPDYFEPYYGLASVHRRRAEAFQAAGDRAARNAAAEAAIAAFVTGTSRNALFHPARLGLADFLARYGDWLAADGAADSAARRYQAARGQLDELLARIPADRRDYALGKLAETTDIDPQAVRRRIDDALRRQP